MSLVHVGLALREVQLCREAFVAGVSWLEYERDGKETAQIAAAKRYPMPMVSVPRVVKVRSTEYRIVNGVPEYRTENMSDWRTDVVLAERARAVVDLLDNPTEQRPADEVSDD